MVNHFGHHESVQKVPCKQSPFPKSFWNELIRLIQYAVKNCSTVRERVACRLTASAWLKRLRPGISSSGTKRLWANRASLEPLQMLDQFTILSRLVTATSLVIHSLLMPWCCLGIKVNHLLIHQSQEGNYGVECQGGSGIKSHSLVCVITRCGHCNYIIIKFN